MAPAEHRDEKALNAAIAVAIGSCHPQSVVEAERASKLVGSAKQPDITVDAPGRDRAGADGADAGALADLVQMRLSAAAVQATDGVGTTEAFGEILNVNYWPIFGVSQKLLRAMNSFVGAKRALEILCRTAGNMVDDPSSSGLVGRLFGELIGDRKFLATFYTRPASAALLAELAVDRLEVDWSDPEAIARLRVADMACGTGALLTAAYRR